VAGTLCASAAQVEGVTLPDRVRMTGSGPELVLNGAGVRTRFIFRVYVGALYLTHKLPSGPAVIEDAGPQRIALHMLRELSAEQFISALQDGLRKNHTAEQLAALDERVRQLRGIFAAAGVAKDGDAITIDYLPGTGTRITINGSDQGTVPGADFRRAMWRIWLGEHPADADLKQAMLGGAT